MKRALVCATEASIELKKKTPAQTPDEILDELYQSLIHHETPPRVLPLSSNESFEKKGSIFRPELTASGTCLHTRTRTNIVI